MRVIAIGAALAVCGAVAACSASGAAPPGSARVAAGAVPARAVDGAAARDPAPGGRLPDGVEPVAYDVTLEVDPAREAFTGRVEIELVAAPATRRIWLHATELALGAATLTVDGRREPVTVLAGPGPLRGFELARPLTGAATLAIAYTGRARDLTGGHDGDEEGLFRERAGGRWYLYSQAESSFARRFVPCFDEPRFKPAWRVTAVVPRGLVVLGNAPVRDERVRPDGRREVRFAEIAALPSYLLALAVGPFELVDAGLVGRGRVPVRLAVAAGDGRRARVDELARLVDALERYLDAPLPLAKLDLVAVPEFFGAMENPGLITVEAEVLVGGRDRVAILGHELAHQWFGDAVTPAWWDHLWLSEAFATWLGERVAAELGARPRPARAHRARAAALAADDARGARPLVHPIAPGEVEPAFDALAYEKGAAVIAMFERFAGPDAFRAAVRAYLAHHAGRAVISQAFLDELAAATTPAIAAALASNLAHAGAPVVALALRCGPPGARLIAEVAGGVTLPICVRFPVAGPADERRCFLAGAHHEEALGAGCPAWVVGNDGGRGYYRVAQGGAPPPPLAQLTPDEQLARGDDLAGAVRHGELGLPGALGEIATRAATRDPYAGLAALAITRAIAGALVAALIAPWRAP